MFESDHVVPALLQASLLPQAGILTFKNFNRTPSFLQLLSIREATDTSDSSFESHDALAFLLRSASPQVWRIPFLEQGMVPDLSGNVGRFAYVCRFLHVGV